MEEVYALANEAFLTVVGIVLTWTVFMLRGFFNAKIAAMDSVMDDEAKKRLEASFESVIALLEKKGKAIDLKQVIDYVQEFNPGDLDRFKLAGQRLVDRARAAVSKSEKKADVEAGAAALIVDTQPRQ